MKTLTVTELEFMRKLWAMRDATPEDIKQSFEDENRILTGGTVRKMLGILMEKGYVERKKLRRTYLYRPAVSAESTKSGLIKDVLNRAFDGSFSHMFASFLDNEKVDAEELEMIAVLIDKHRKEQKND
ncbi:MAG: BlaI/MecI/CopY family transcriptional regulator [Candidatus Latescibacteria bacterium]|nr:BlaI/MecI/CopY family transcriptional regulator [Candidatus Latescibacterota bacterium]